MSSFADLLDELPHAAGSLELQVQIVEEHQEDAARRVVHAAHRRKDDAFRRRERRRFEHVGDAPAADDGQRREFLLHAVLEDLEIVLRQIGDEPAVLVLDDHVHRDGIDLDSERGRLLRTRSSRLDWARAPEPTDPRRGPPTGRRNTSVSLSQPWQKDYASFDASRASFDGSAGRAPARSDASTGPSARRRGGRRRLNSSRFVGLAQPRRAPAGCLDGGAGSPRRWRRRCTRRPSLDASAAGAAISAPARPERPSPSRPRHLGRESPLDEGAVGDSRRSSAASTSEAATARRPRARRPRPPALRLSARAWPPCPPCGARASTRRRARAPECSTAFSSRRRLRGSGPRARAGRPRRRARVRS